jgi:hypothetical protein
VAQLPLNIEDVERFYNIQARDEPQLPWHTDYYKKDGSSSKRRLDALYSEAFVTPMYPKDSSPGPTLEKVESLVKVTHDKKTLTVGNGAHAG